MEDFTIENLNKYAKHCGQAFCYKFGGVRFAHNLKSILYLTETEEFAYVDEVSLFFENGTNMTETRMSSARGVNSFIESKKWV